MSGGGNRNSAEWDMRLADGNALNCSSSVSSLPTRCGSCVAEHETYPNSLAVIQRELDEAKKTPDDV
jgi:hypothetical protein